MSEQFLVEYEELCLKFGLVVDSCGCCDSPWVKKPDPNNSGPGSGHGTIKEHLEHLKKEMEERRN